MHLNYITIGGKLLAKNITKDFQEGFDLFELTVETTLSDKPQRHIVEQLVPNDKENCFLSGLSQGDHLIVQGEYRYEVVDRGRQHTERYHYIVSDKTEKIHLVGLDTKISRLNMAGNLATDADIKYGEEYDTVFFTIVMSDNYRNDGQTLNIRVIKSAKKGAFDDIFPFLKKGAGVFATGELVYSKKTKGQKVYNNATLSARDGFFKITNLCPDHREEGIPFSLGGQAF